MPRRVNFSNLDGTWKQGVGVPVGFIAKYLVGLPVVQSILKRLAQKVFPPSFLRTIFKSTLRLASQPLENGFPVAEMRLQSLGSPLNLLQFPEGFVYSEKKSTPFGLTQISQQLMGQLFMDAIKISTASYLYRGSLHLVKVEMIYWSMFYQTTYKNFLSWHKLAFVVESVFP